MGLLLLQAGLLILKSVAGFLSILLLLRFYMQAFRVSFSNQVGTFVLQLTSWLVVPLRKVIPAVFGFDSASLVATYLLQVIVLTAEISLHAGLSVLSPENTALLILLRSLVALLRLSVYLLIGLLILQAVLSWVNPHAPIGRPISQITQPFLRPIQRVLPPIANIDLSPLIAILIAQILLIFLQ
ncbi:YggT family protein [Propionivibrio limicola]|uniref:YggT family protein n=1 Tax=Propionivibrio limicola TaxID=167645 RepID=UPI00129285E0|nr:YggT family protein [Propionivibrio limicola]